MPLVTALQKRLYQITSLVIIPFAIEVITTIEKPDSTTLMRDTIILLGVDLYLPMIQHI